MSNLRSKSKINYNLEWREYICKHIEENGMSWLRINPLINWGIVIKRICRRLTSLKKKKRRFESNTSHTNQPDRTSKLRQCATHAQCSRSFVFLRCTAWKTDTTTLAPPLLPAQGAVGNAHQQGQLSLEPGVVVDAYAHTPCYSSNIKKHVESS